MSVRGGLHNRLYNSLESDTCHALFDGLDFRYGLSLAFPRCFIGSPRGRSRRGDKRIGLILIGFLGQTDSKTSSVDRYRREVCGDLGVRFPVNGFGHEYVPITDGRSPRCRPRFPDVREGSSEVTFGRWRCEGSGKTFERVRGSGDPLTESAGGRRGDRSLRRVGRVRGQG